MPKTFVKTIKKTHPIQLGSDSIKSIMSVTSTIYSEQFKDQAIADIRNAPGISRLKTGPRPLLVAASRRKLIYKILRGLNSLYWAIRPAPILFKDGKILVIADAVGVQVAFTGFHFGFITISSPPI